MPPEFSSESFGEVSRGPAGIPPRHSQMAQREIWDVGDNFFNREFSLSRSSTKVKMAEDCSSRSQIEAFA